MKCKYWDAGWCYAPKDVKTNATQGGCFEPEYCPYITENKKMLDEDKLVREIKELELEIKSGKQTLSVAQHMLERKQQQLKEINDLQNKLETKNWKVDTMNAIYPMLEVIDENTVKIEGVEYKKVEEQKPQTLLEYLNSFRMVNAEGVCNIVRSWLIDHTVIETEDAEKVTFTILKEQLQTTK